MKVRKAVFPVAGLGTRFLPATKAVPKEMLPLVDKPLIQYGVEEVISAGIEEIIMVNGRGKQAIEDHFDRAVELEAMLERKGDHERLAMVRKIADMVEVVSVRQKDPLGLGHAILCARDLVGDEPFMVLLGDDIIHTPNGSATAEMIEIFNEKQDPVIAIERVPMESVSAYGVIDAEPVGERTHKINGMVEKPPCNEAPSDLAIIGRYVLTPDIFDAIEKTGADGKGEIQLTAALDAVRQSRPVYGYEFSGKRYDAGDKLGFLKATVEGALRHPNLGEPFRHYLKGLEV